MDFTFRRTFERLRSELQELTDTLSDHRVWLIESGARGGLWYLWHVYVSVPLVWSLIGGQWRIRGRVDGWIASPLGDFHPTN